MNSIYKFNINIKSLFTIIILIIIINGVLMLQERNSLKCFLRNANNSLGYLFASNDKDPSSFDRMISTLPLDEVADTDMIKWELIAFDEEIKNNLFLIKNVKYNEFLCASKYHSDKTRQKRKVIGWKLKFGINQKINVLGHMVNALDMMREEKKCIWKLGNVNFNKYVILNAHYNEPIFPVINANVYAWHRSDVNGIEFNWFIDCVTIDFNKK